MHRYRICAVLVCAALIVSGCGTAANLVWLNREEGGQRVYGGARVDWIKVQEAVTDPTVRYADGGTRTQVALLFALDLPFTIIGDTLTLPLTLAWALDRDAIDRESNRGPAASAADGTAIPPPSPASQNPQ